MYKFDERHGLKGQYLAKAGLPSKRETWQRKQQTTPTAKQGKEQWGMRRDKQEQQGRAHQRKVTGEKSSGILF